MIAAAVALAATFANAGAYTWGFGSSADIMPGGDASNDEYLDGGTAMLFLGTIAQTATGEGSGIDAKYSLDFTGLTKIATSGQSGSDYTFGQIEYDAGYVSDAITERTSQDYTLILFADDGVTDYENYEGYYYVLTGSSTPTQDAATDGYFADFTSGDAVAGDAWRTAAPMDSPEPTSGLLLLLGVAGLALKRKRA